MVKEGKINFCVNKESINLAGCLSANVDTSYSVNRYNCSSCIINHLPYYSEFYERYICQSIFDEIKTSQDINLDNYQKYHRIEAINGECQNNSFFTPDGKYCYKCNSYIGMQGCKSQCSFSLERNNIIKCLDGCIDGYIESTEGICEPCSSINYGCSKCHYDNYPTDYSGIKRKRKFICDYCYYDNYIIKDDECTSCYSLENGCDKCEIENNEFKCKHCYNPYFLDEEGHCNYCYNGYIFENQCNKCYDINSGGIEGCNYCNFYQNKLTCNSCKEGYILLKNNGTCLKLSENIKLRKHNKCREISLEDNIFHCLECKDYKYSVLKGNNESVCIYLPELNGYIDDDSFYSDDLYYYEKNPNFDYIYKFYFNKYIIKHYFSHCIEVINLGSEDNPLYSCIKCNYQNYLYAEENSNISYCVYNYLVGNID